MATFKCTETYEVKPDADWETVDGNTAAVYSAYALSECSFIYPITPSSPMGESADEWAAKGRLNIWGRPLIITEMQSEGGAAGGVHGACSIGSLCTTFTASQGLLLMIPNMYKIAGELMPCVFHVSARAIAGQATRQTGFSLLCANTVQEAEDMALISHIASVRANMPFVHFFDGFRTSHEVSKIILTPYSEIAKLVNNDEAYQAGLKRHRDRGLHPNHPSSKGTAEPPDVYFQLCEAANKAYEVIPDIVEDVMRAVEKVTHRGYHLFDYCGDMNAEFVIVVMGSATPVIQEIVQLLLREGKKVGLVKVHLYRPWRLESFLSVLPKTVKRIAVLDRTKESGSFGEPLFLDVAASIQQLDRHVMVIGGRYGLGSKDFSPACALSVYKNLMSDNPRRRFTVGIEDDVTHLSLELGAPIDTVPNGTRQSLFWGMGSDGTVTANKEAIKIIGDNTKLYVQAYFQYDAKKSGGVTVSHLRFGPNPLHSSYYVNHADYVACHYPFYVRSFDLVRVSKPNSIFVLNSKFSLEDMEKIFPNSLKRAIAKKHLDFYNIDALAVSEKAGLGKRINMVMQSVFFKLSGVIPMSEAIPLLKKSVVKAFGKKGQSIVEANYRAIDAGVDTLVKISYPAAWADLPDDPVVVLGPEKDGFVNRILKEVNQFRGDDLKVSEFEAGGAIPMATTQWEKRTIAARIPIWIPANCTQCNYCAYSCPHAAIRPFLIDESVEYKDQPPTYKVIKAQGAGTEGLSYRIQVAPDDCTGCELCYSACGDNALTMEPILNHLDEERVNWSFGRSLPEFGERFDKKNATVKTSQFQTPLFEFSGACEGCGETPYIKLLTQLYGDRMVISNATGCSSIFGASYPANPYAVDKNGRGPSWANSLFEDNAEYGLGMVMGNITRRTQFRKEVNDVLAAKDIKLSDELRSKLTEWIDNYKNPAVCTRLNDELPALLKSEKDPRLVRLYEMKDMIPKLSFWIVGGDGWAYDIGYGGLDHVLSCGEDLNVFVLDTEVYSNTGGQKSKSAVAKFAYSGKTRPKKELGMIAMQYRDIYVAQISIGSAMSHTLKCIQEAENYPGTSLIIAYAPCIAQGTKLFNKVARDKAAIDSGYWPLYHYDPRLREAGQNPFVLDSKKIKCEVSEFIAHENRFASLLRSFPDLAKKLQAELQEYCTDRHALMKLLASDAKSQVGAKGTAENSMLILYGSETGNAEELSKTLEVEAKKRDFSTTRVSLDDYEYEELLADEPLVLIVCSTAGQGDFPQNAKSFASWISKVEEKKSLKLDKTRFAVFGLGDHNYIYFNKAARSLDESFGKCGAKRLVPCGLGDDQDPDGKETKWEEWLPLLWASLNAKEPPAETKPPAENYKVETVTKAAPASILPVGAMECEIKENRLLTPEGYDRDIRHYDISLGGKKVKYGLGDSLAVWPKNDFKQVEEFLSFYKLNGKDVVQINLANPTLKANPNIPSLCTVQQLFSEVLDLFGRPSRRFYRALALFAQDKEREQLLRIVSPAGVAEYQALVDESVTYYDLLKKFPSAHPSLAYIIDLIPPVKKMHPGNVQLCIVLVDWKAKSGVTRYGLTTSYLRTLKKGEKLRCQVSKSAFHLPPQPTVPVLMAGMGTGMAPFRAFVQEWAMLKRAGTKTGPMVMFFGCRHRKTDFLYGDEMDGYVKEGVLTNLYDACSRDQEYKIYVQNRIEQNSELVYDLLEKKGGYFYMCGQAGKVPEQIRKAVEKAYVVGGKMKPEDAVLRVEQMVKEGQYNIEAY